MRDAEHEVAAAAIAWNRARLRRIAVTKRIPIDWRVDRYSAARTAYTLARKDEARALAALRKACAAAAPLTVEAELIPAKAIVWEVCA